ncbi:MAG: 50S ribosomal protein L25, partial [Chromatiaceae bacterium]|nr:50S ribosomal protein L25 [Chromatiaceae bacterium]
LDLGGIIHLSEVPLPPGVELAQAPDPDVPVVVIHSGHGGEGEEEGGEA